VRPYRPYRPHRPHPHAALIANDVITAEQGDPASCSKKEREKNNAESTSLNLLNPGQTGISDQLAIFHSVSSVCPGARAATPTSANLNKKGTWQRRPTT
jgi:hypothetical protein